MMRFLPKLLYISESSKLEAENAHFALIMLLIPRILAYHATIFTLGKTSIFALLSLNQMVRTFVAKSLHLYHLIREYQLLTWWD